MADTIEVANMSLGGRGYKTACGEDDPMHNAVCFSSKRVIYVVAAGNSTDDVAGYTPAGYKEAVTVSALADFDGQPGGAALAPDNRCAAMSVDDELAAFSNYGEGVDIAAPGTCILSTLPGNVTKDGEYIPAYGYASGTSMATPHVTGAIARFLSENPDQRDEAWQQVLMWSSSHELLAEGDHDAVPEPVLYVGNGTPRYVPGKNAPPGS
jgi:subtilisin family serine protease